MFYLIRLQYYKKTLIQKNVLWNNYTLFLLLAFFGQKLAFFEHPHH
jgi:hypothetical protein